MATITGLTAGRMIAIEASSIVDAHMDGDDLILVQFDDTEINVGSVRGPTGFTPELKGLSVTSTTVGTGSKTFAISPAMSVPFPVGSVVRVVGASAANFMVGVVTASSTTSVTINVTQTGGSGTFASWTAAIGAFDGTLAGHNHVATDVNSGVFDVARIPSHGHAAADITSGTLAAARLPQATQSAIGALEVATATEVRTGTDDVRAITPLGLAGSVVPSGTVAGDDYYEKWSNGFLICRSRHALVSDSVSVNTVWTYPIAFVGADPIVLTNIDSSSLGTTMRSSASSVGLVSAQINLYRASAASTNVDAIAIGRWK